MGCFGGFIPPKTGPNLTAVHRCKAASWAAPNLAPILLEAIVASKLLLLGLSAPSPDHISFDIKRNMEKKNAGVPPLDPFRPACWRKRLGGATQCH